MTAAGAMPTKVFRRGHVTAASPDKDLQNVLPQGAPLGKKRAP
jgi:hypothetical protein